MNDAYPKISYFSTVNLKELRHVLSFIDEQLAANPTTLQFECKTLGNACRSYARDGQNLLPAEDQDHLDNVVDQMVVHMPEHETYLIENFIPVCRLVPNASVLYPMYPERFSGKFSEVMEIVQYMPEGLLDLPIVSMSGKTMTGQPIGRLLPQMRMMEEGELLASINGAPKPLDIMKEDMADMTDEQRQPLQQFLETAEMSATPEGFVIASPFSACGLF